MSHDYKKGAEIMHRMVMEEKAERAKKEKEEIEKGLGKPKASYYTTEEYVDQCDIPGAMDDGVALLLYIVAMIIGIIFKDRWLIWIGATILYLCHVFRRQLHKAKWEREHKDK